MTALAIIVMTALIAPSALPPGHASGSRKPSRRSWTPSHPAIMRYGTRSWTMTCVMTGEEGEQLTKAAFLKALHPLPQGLSGEIRVRDLTVQDLQDVAVVRFMADESETVFGQRLATKYRITDVFRRSGDTWRMVASHASVITARSSGAGCFERGLARTRRRLQVAAGRLDVPRGVARWPAVRWARSKRAPPAHSDEPDGVCLDGIARRVAVRDRLGRKGNQDRESEEIRAARVDPRQRVQARPAASLLRRRLPREDQVVLVREQLHIVHPHKPRVAHPSSERLAGHLEFRLIRGAAPSPPRNRRPRCGLMARGRWLAS